MSRPVEVGQDLALFEAFVEACRPILAAGFGHAAKGAPERHAEIMGLIHDQRAVPRLVVAWDAELVIVTVEAAGITEEGSAVSFPVFRYQLKRRTPKEAH